MGFIDYVKEKKEQYDLKRAEREKTQVLQDRLDRQALRQDAMSARSEMREMRSAERDRRDIMALDNYKIKQRQANSPFAKIGAGIDSIDRANRDLFGSPKKSKDLYGSMFGGSPKGSGNPDLFGGGFGGSHQRSRSKRRSKSNKEIVIRLKR